MLCLESREPAAPSTSGQFEAMPLSAKVDRKAEKVSFHGSEVKKPGLRPKGAMAEKPKEKLLTEKVEKKEETQVVGQIGMKCSDCLKEREHKCKQEAEGNEGEGEEPRAGSMASDWTAAGGGILEELLVKPEGIKMETPKVQPLAEEEEKKQVGRSINCQGAEMEKKCAPSPFPGRSPFIPPSPFPSIPAFRGCVMQGKQGLNPNANPYAPQSSL